MNIAVIGSGYVGLVQGAGLAEFGLSVVCVDNDKKKVEMLKKGKVPFYEPGLDELVKRNRDAGKLSFTTDISKAIKDALVIFIAVGTPPNGDGSANLEYVRSVAREIGKNLDDYKIIVTKSTVPVGTGGEIKKIISDVAGNDAKFDVVSNPEFLREGSAIDDFMHPNRVVIGVDNPSGQAVAIMKDLYHPLYLIETPIVVTDIKTAELIKYSSNAFLATKISFINEMANLCEVVGADVQTVAKAMGLDQRIGPKFLHAGPGYGGSCFPKDSRALARIGEEHGIKLGIIQAANKANEKQKIKAVEKISCALKGKLKGRTICILGISFKPNTNDLRDAPALFIIEQLLRGGVKIRAYDPQAMEDAKKKFPKITYCMDAYDAAKGADALVIVTEWNQFRNLDLGKIKKIMKDEVFVDLRNIYEPEKVRKAGFQYHSIGRP